MGGPPSISHRTTRHAGAVRVVGPVHSGIGSEVVTYECRLPQNLKKAEGEQFRSPSVSRGGVLEEVLHVQFDNSRVWSPRLGVHNPEGAGVVVLCNGFTGVVHVVTQPERPSTSRRTETRERVVQPVKGAGPELDD